MNKNEWLLQYIGSFSERDMTLLGRCYDVLQKNIIQGEERSYVAERCVLCYKGTLRLRIRGYCFEYEGIYSRYGV